jgi:hypothetical protein
MGPATKKLATAFCARRSAVSDRVRDPVNRQTTITLASASMTLPNAQPTSAVEPALYPATRPRTPSAVIQASDPPSQPARVPRRAEPLLILHSWSYRAASVATVSCRRS